MVEIMKIMAASFKSSHALQRSVPLTLQEATVDPRLRQRLSEPHRQVGLAVVGSLLLSPGSWWDKVLFVPLKSLFPQSIKALCCHPAYLTYM